MRNLLVALSLLALAACTNIHPLKTVGPDTYQVTHTYRSTTNPQATQAAHSGLESIGRNTCAKQDNAPYQKLTEESTSSGSRHTITLTFTCKPVLKASGYTPGFTENRPTAHISYTAPIGVSPTQVPAE